MTKPITAKQHYVPRAFLKRWCIDGESFFPIKVEEKNPPKLKILSKTSVDTFCHENFFYANTPGKKDEFSQEVEDGFTETENQIYGILDLFEEKILNNKQITFEDKYELSYVMLFLHLRGKKHLTWSREFSDEMAKTFYKHHLEATEYKDMKKHGINEEQANEILEGLTVEFGTAHHLKQLKNIPEYAFHIARKYWKVSVSKKAEFIITDTPYHDFPVENKHLMSNNIYGRLQFFSLSPKIHIKITEPHDINAKNINRKDVTSQPLEVDHLNVLSLMNSVMFGFHSEEDVLRRVIDWANKLKLFRDLNKNESIYPN